MRTIVGYKIVWSTGISSLNDKIEALMNSQPLNAEQWQPHGRPRFDQGIWIQPMAQIRGELQ